MIALGTLWLLPKEIYIYDIKTKPMHYAMTCGWILFPGKKQDLPAVSFGAIFLCLATAIPTGMPSIKINLIKNRIFH